MPISGTISSAPGPQSTPTPAAARAAYAAAHPEPAPQMQQSPPLVERGRAAGTLPPVTSATAPGAAAGAPGAAPAAGAAAGAPGAAAGAPPPDAKPGDEKYEAWRVEALARREREATQARLAAKAEREALARERGAMEAREKSLADREAQMDALDKRLNAYKLNPHLALQDLAQYGVSFEMLAQAVAQGYASPDQIAAVEATQARQEVEAFKAEQAREKAEAAEAAEREKRERETRAQKQAREREERERKERAAAEAEATQEWKNEIRAIAAREVESLPFFNEQIDRGALDRAFSFAEDFLAKQNRIPTNEEVLSGVEAALQAEAEAMAQTLARVRPRPGNVPAATLSNQFRPSATPRPAAPLTEAERKARVMAEIDKAFGRGR